jgi:hypothetical protein
MTKTIDSPPSNSRRDQTLTIVRVVHFLLAVIVFPFFVGLTFYPTRTDVNFAWPLTPPMSCILFGSLYLAVAYSFMRVAFSQKWHHIAMILWATLPVLSLLGVVTVLHWEKFTGPPLPLWIWLSVYLGFPPILLILILINRQQDPKVGEIDDTQIPSWISICSFILGLVFGFIGVLLFFCPSLMIPHWPWALKPLSCQAIGCLFMAPTLTHLIAFREKRWSALKILSQSALLWFVAVGVGVIRFWEDFQHDRLSTYVWLTVLGIELTFIIAAYVTMERRRLARSR